MTEAGKKLGEVATQKVSEVSGTVSEKVCNVLISFILYLAARLIPLIFILLFYFQHDLFLCFVYLYVFIVGFFTHKG